MRFHAARGAMSVGESQGGLPPDSVVESESAILADSQRLIERWHDPARHAMQRIVVAPCSPFSVSRRADARRGAAGARARRVAAHPPGRERQRHRLHAREFGCTPAEYAEALGWSAPTSGTRTASSSDAAGIALFAKTGTGVAHRPARTCAWRPAWRRSGDARRRRAGLDRGRRLGQQRQRPPSRRGPARAAAAARRPWAGEGSFGP